MEESLRLRMYSRHVDCLLSLSLSCVLLTLLLAWLRSTHLEEEREDVVVLLHEGHDERHPQIHAAEGVAVGGEEVLVLDEHLHAALVAPIRGDHQRRPSVTAKRERTEEVRFELLLVVSCVRVSCDVCVCVVWCVCVCVRECVPVARIYIGVVRQQETHDLIVPLGCGKHQCGAPVAGLALVDLGAVLHEHAHELLLALGGGDHQRGPSVLPRFVHHTRSLVGRCTIAKSKAG